MFSSQAAGYNYQSYAQNYANRIPSNQLRPNQGDLNGGVNKTLIETRQTNAILESQFVPQASIAQNFQSFQTRGQSSPSKWNDGEQTQHGSLKFVRVQGQEPTKISNQTCKVFYLSDPIIPTAKNIHEELPHPRSPQKYKKIKIGFNQIAQSQYQNYASRLVMRPTEVVYRPAPVYTYVQQNRIDETTRDNQILEETIARPAYSRIYDDKKELYKDLAADSDPISKKTQCDTFFWMLLGLMGLLVLAVGVILGLGLFNSGKQGVDVGKASSVSPNPNITTPNTKIPPIPVTNVTKPNITAPVMPVPSIATPHITAPVMPVPSIVTPHITAPVMPVPSIVTPHITAPVMPVPRIVTPHITAPVMPVPSIATPHITAPVMPVPNIATPHISTPNITTPVVPNPDLFPSAVPKIPVYTNPAPVQDLSALPSTFPETDDSLFEPSVISEISPLTTVEPLEIIQILQIPPRKSTYGIGPARPDNQPSEGEDFIAPSTVPLKAITITSKKSS